MPDPLTLRRRDHGGGRRPDLRRAAFRPATAALRSWSAALRGLGVAAILCLSLPVRAQEGEAPAANRTAAATVNTTAEAAEAALAAGEWQTASRLFGELRRDAPSLRAYRGEAVAALELGRWVRAQRALDAAMSLDDATLDAEVLEELQRLAGRAGAHVGRLTVEAAPEGSVLEVDGEPVVVSGEWPRREGTVLVRAGLRRFLLTLPTGANVRVDYTVAGGEVGPLELSLGEALASEGPAPIEAGRDDEPEAFPASESGEPSSALGGWTLFGVGASVALGGAVTLTLGLSDLAQPERSTESLRPTLTGVGSAALVLGAALWGLGLWIALEEESRDEVDARRAE